MAGMQRRIDRVVDDPTAKEEKKRATNADTRDDVDAIGGTHRPHRSDHAMPNESSTVRPRRIQCVDPDPHGDRQ
jgi:hypothetical protein